MRTAILFNLKPNQSTSIMKTTYFLGQSINLFKPNTIGILIFALCITLVNAKSSVANANSANIIANSNVVNKTIKGQSGGSTDSKGCGFVSNSPSYEMNLEERIDYMRFTVQADGGQPTLLVMGPNSGDSFCVLGDRVSGLKPEISGVWEAGYYEIYVGDRTGERHQFSLDISTNN